MDINELLKDYVTSVKVDNSQKPIFVYTFTYNENLEDKNFVKKTLLEHFTNPIFEETDNELVMTIDRGK